MGFFVFCVCGIVVVGVYLVGLVLFCLCFFAGVFFVCLVGWVFFSGSFKSCDIKSLKVEYITYPFLNRLEIGCCYILNRYFVIISTFNQKFNFLFPCWMGCFKTSSVSLFLKWHLEALASTRCLLVCACLMMARYHQCPLLSCILMNKFLHWSQSMCLMGLGHNSMRLPVTVTTTVTIIAAAGT